MGLFDKKYCDFCGNKIGLLGNRKFEDGNMCKDCAAKLSPWFDERRHSTKQTLTEQLEAREANKAAVAAFGATRKLGKYTKLVIDEVNRKFMVTSSNNYEKDNPDVFDFSQARGCDLSISESRTELKTKNAEGKSISYNPPRYEYSYNFYATISVNHPYVDDMKFSITNGYIKTGERRMDGASTGWRMDMRMPASLRIQAYNDAIDLGNEIKEAVEDMRRIANGETPHKASTTGTATGAAGATAAAATAASTAAPATAAPPVKIVCPYCGAPTFLDSNHCCEYCGSKIQI